MEDHKPFLDSKLTLTSLAAMMGTNRVNLSRLINKTYGVNFNKYINNRRLVELEALRRDANKPLAELIKLAGFGSYDSYNRARRGGRK